MQISALKDLTRIEQALFGLPFVLSGAFLGLGHAWNWESLLWIFPSFMMARISGMAFNQLIDRHIDAHNPRTSQRAIPSGRVLVFQARWIAWVSLLLFVLLCFQINRLTAWLSISAATLIYLYSYMKRVHACCHFVLAGVHFLAPMMAFTAMTGKLSLGPIYLGFIAAFSIAGFDIVYAIQDYDYDCKEGLFSIPSRFGIQKSLTFSIIIHFLTLPLFILLGLSEHMPLIYYLVIPVVLGILVHFHLKIRQIGFSEHLFFTSTVGISGFSLLFILLSCVWDVL
jgi:4-hydroxybenzoate polyprenyltransferase